MRILAGIIIVAIVLFVFVFVFEDDAGNKLIDFISTVIGYVIGAILTIIIFKLLF